MIEAVDKEDFAELNIRASENLMQLIGVRNKYKDLTFRSFTAAYESVVAGVAAEFVKNFLDHRNEGQGLYFYSPTPNCGKTHLAAATYNYMVAKGCLSLFLNMTDFVALYDRNKEIFHQIAKAARMVDYLVLDGLGDVLPSDKVIAVLNDIVHQRTLNIKKSVKKDYYHPNVPEPIPDDRVLELDKLVTSVTTRCEDSVLGSFLGSEQIANLHSRSVMVEFQSKTGYGSAARWPYDQ
jgi:hypothetical protein